MQMQVEVNIEKKEISEIFILAVTRKTLSEQISIGTHSSFFKNVPEAQLS